MVEMALFLKVGFLLDKGAREAEELERAGAA
jgi:hypothetical protein